LVKVRDLVAGDLVGEFEIRGDLARIARVRVVGRDLLQQCGQVLPVGVVRGTSVQPAAAISWSATS
jgi:hypothetical protein